MNHPDADDPLAKRQPAPWKAPTPINEAQRLAALHQYRVLDTSPERSFDDLARIAAAICGTPIALASLVDTDRQWFKARVGLDVSETPREGAFCAHTILGETPFVVEDARVDPRFARSPLVVGEPGVRFYAGAPLLTSDGLALGSLCVIDREARRLSGEQLDALAALARSVVALLETRRTMAALAEALENVRALEALIPMCAWCKNVRCDEGYWHDVEDYLKRIAGSDVSHGICPPCMDKVREGIHP